MTARILRALVFVALVIASAHARAADPDGEAREHYVRGAQAYDKGRYKDAIDEFSAADRLVPRPALAYNIARSYHRLGDDSGALAHYRDYLRRAPDAPDREKVERLVKELAQALQKKGVQQVTILSEPPRATVVLDGQPVGVTPWTGELVPGEHRFALDLEGHARVEKTFTLEVSQPLDVSQKLEPKAVDAKSEKIARAPAAKPAARVTPIEPRPSATHARISPITWGALGLGVVAVGGAIGFEFSRARAERDSQQASTQIEARERYDAMQRRQTTARVLVGVGTVASVAGGLLLYLDLTSQETAGVRTGLACANRACSVIGVGKF